MLLSFSIPEMRVMIEAGLAERQATGFPASAAATSASPRGGARTKRQTIRARGVQWQRVLAETEGGQTGGGKVERDLHLWWKSRTKERRHLGTLRGFEAYPVSIAYVTGHVEIRLPTFNTSSPVVATALADLRPGKHIFAHDIARDDGFDQWLDFVNFFVPKPGDRFAGVLIKW